MSLAIDKVTVTDDVTMIAKTAKITIKPANKISNPAAEFGFPGDSAGTGISSQRPSDQVVEIQLSYTNNPLAPIFTGLIDFMDDLEDPNLYSADLDLSDVPVGHPHRKKTTTFFSNLQYGPGTVMGFTVNFQTAHSILQELCRRLGITFGRCDLPDYPIVGTFEVHQQTITEVASRLIGCFNTFAYMQFFPRIDRNGLQIIKIDYTLGGEVTNGYEIPSSKIKKKTRSFEAYLPSNMVGGADVLLTGAGIPGITTDPGSGEGPQGASGAPVHIAEEVFTVTTSTSSRDDVNIPSIHDFDTWVENEVVTNLHILFTGYDVTNVPTSWSTTKRSQRSRTLFGTAADPPITVIPPTEVNPDGSASVVFGSVLFVENYSVIAQDPVSLETRTYDELNGLIQSSTTSYTYEVREVKTGPAFALQTTKKRLLVFERIETYWYVNGEKILNKAINQYYQYDEYGNSTTKFSKQFYGYRTQWIYDRSHIDVTQNIDLTASVTPITNASEAYLAELGFGATAYQSSVSPVNTVGRLQYTFNESLDQYRLFNGSALTKDNFYMNIPTSPMVQNLTDSQRRREIEAAFQRTNLAWKQNCDHMDYHGLQLIWALVQREIALEKKTCYWEHTEVEAVLDLTPVSGESIILDGASFIVDKVMQTADQNSATTTIKGKRLVVLQ